ncbi:MAG: RHS repeat-associated core domain-containing protein [Planctomycetota bacterium]
MSGAWRRERNYTQHRHFDPILMRFTSPDPIASPFFNLGAYVGNNPARFYDPDGLARKKWSSDTITKDLIEAGLDIFKGVLMKAYGAPAALFWSGKQMADGESAGDTEVGQSVQEMGDRYEARVENNGGGIALIKRLSKTLLRRFRWGSGRKRASRPMLRPAYALAKSLIKHRRFDPGPFLQRSTTPLLQGQLRPSLNTLRKWGDSVNGVAGTPVLYQPSKMDASCRLP